MLITTKQTTNIKMKISVFVRWDKSFEGVAEITFPVLSAYCKRHGYALEMVEYTKITDRLLPMFFDHRDFDVMVHVDADVLITNPERRYEDILSAHPESTVLVGSDCNGINDGTMMIRNTPLGQLFALEMQKRTDMKDITSPQGALQQMVDCDPVFAKHVAILQQRTINSYVTIEYSEYHGLDVLWNNWLQGDFCLHVPALSIEKRIEILNNHVSRN